MPHKPENTQSIGKAFAHYRDKDHAAFRHRKTKHSYPNGRKTGCDNIITDEYRENFDRIFRNEEVAQTLPNKTALASSSRQGQSPESSNAGANPVAPHTEPNDFDEPPPRKKKR